ncbi:MAG: hypothetical protein ACXWNQ_05990 [Anaerolineales bacterium]
MVRATSILLPQVEARAMVDVNIGGATLYDGFVNAEQSDPIITKSISELLHNQSQDGANRANWFASMYLLQQ